MWETIHAEHSLITESTLTAVQPSGVSRQLCLLCEDYPANVRFSPCGHTVLCSRCAERAKKCLHCKVSSTVAIKYNMHEC